VVWKVVERRSGRGWALKKNFDAFQNATDAQRTYREIMFLRQFKHPNIVQIREVIRSVSEKDIYILFEFMDIDLYTLIRENMLGEQHKRYIIYQVAKAMHYLHTAELIHRDIKPSNVLVNEDCLAKICDFGLIRSVDDEDELPPVLTDYIATRWYRAPEILLGSKKYSKAADVWSFGCMLGELIRGKPMFPGHSTLNQIERVLTWTGPPTIQDLKSLKTDFGKEMLDILTKIKPLSRKEWFSNCSADAIDLIARTLSFNPDKRPTMLEVLKHPYLKEFYSKQEIVESESKIRIEVDDNQKLSLKEYRALIYKIV
jgi:mitogen-activated protein kinase 15